MTRFVAILAYIVLSIAPAFSQDVAPPYAHLEYCYKARDAGCARTLTPHDLAVINMVVTDAIKTVENLDPLDPWTPFPASHTGDCDDDAATKRGALLGLGFDPKAMHFETGLANGERHIVLVVTIDGKEWVMDRKTPDRVYPANKRPYDWKPQERETAGSLNWTG